MSNKAVALGLFDGLHLGHAKVLNAALETVDTASEVNSDNVTRSLVFTFGDAASLPKHASRRSQRIITNAQKLKLLSRMGFDEIYECDFAEVGHLTASEFASEYLVKRFSAKVAACGSNFRLGSDGKTALQFKKICGNLGIKLVIVPVVSVFGQAVSSTVIRGAIAAGDIGKANKLLGYDLFYELPVVPGLRLARELGAPTINQRLPDDLVKPLYGVYESYANIGGVGYKGVTNVGVKPTVTDDNVTFIETHLLGYSGGSLYGKTVVVALRRFLREERKWATLPQLKNAIMKDVRRVRESKNF